jgi:hypothetical protein
MKHGMLKTKAKRAFAPPKPDGNKGILPVALGAASASAQEGEGDPFVGAIRPMAGEMRKTPQYYAQRKASR